MADDRVGYALRMVADALRPIVESEMTRAHGPSWRDSARGLRPGLDRGLDASALFATVQNNWQTVFAVRFGPMNRALVSELRETRNRWAHQEAFEESDIARALDTAARFLKSLGSPLHEVVWRPSIEVAPGPAKSSVPKRVLRAPVTVANAQAPLETAFAAECGPAARRFGSPASGVHGFSDDAAGVQWNLTIHRNDGHATFGVNLEGMKYDGWPIARLLLRESDRPTLPELASTMPRTDEVELVVWRDAWQASSRVKIEERYVSTTPIELARLTVEAWARTLEEARACLDESKSFLGRGVQSVTLSGKRLKVERPVTPHLQFRLPLRATTRQAIGAAKATLQPLHDWVRERSRP